MWTKSACWGVQLLGLVLLVLGGLAILAGSAMFGVLVVVGGLALIVRGGNKMAERLKG